MKIKIEKKTEDKFLVLFSDDEKDVKGVYLSKMELKKLRSNLDQILEYDLEQVGDSI
jgi:hypothetical protein